MDSEALMTEWMPAISPLSPVLFSAALGATAVISCGSLAVAYRCIQWKGKGSNPEKIVQVKKQVCRFVTNKKSIVIVLPKHYSQVNQNRSDISATYGCLHHSTPSGPSQQ